MEPPAARVCWNWRASVIEKFRADAALIMTIRRAESRGEEPPDMSERSCPAAPLAVWTEEGKLEWNNNLRTAIEHLAGITDSN